MTEHRRELKRECPGCGWPLIQRVTCSWCWAKMPAAIRSEFIAAYRRRTGDGIRYREAVIDVLLWCQERRAALSRSDREEGADVRHR